MSSLFDTSANAVRDNRQPSVFPLMATTALQEAQGPAFEHACT